MRHEEAAAFMACAYAKYTIAAQLAYPDRQCIAFVGDGGFSMLMAEFVTCVKYQLPVKVVIVKNGTLGQIKWEQMMHEGILSLVASYSRLTLLPLQRLVVERVLLSMTQRTVALFSTWHLLHRVQWLWKLSSIP